MLTLAAYGALGQVAPGRGDPSHAWLRRDIPIFIRDLALGVNGDRVAQCYTSGSSFRDCLNLATTLGVVPKFEDYAAEVEMAARETGEGASCRR
jgi:hypothetical protein